MISFGNELFCDEGFMTWKALDRGVYKLSVAVE